MHLAIKNYFKKVAFLESDVNHMRKGASKYGCGNWVSILDDPSFKFYPSRKACLLAVHVKNMILWQMKILGTLQQSNSV